jgi:hypothetical protein
MLWSCLVFCNNGLLLFEGKKASADHRKDYDKISSGWIIYRRIIANLSVQIPCQ